MKVYAFEEIIDVIRFANCASCDTYTYTLPCIIDVDFGAYLLGIGKTKYPLDRIKMVRVDNELVKLTSRVGRTWLEIKFKKHHDKIKPLFDIQMASYVEAKKNILIRYGSEL